MKSAHACVRCLYAVCFTPMCKAGTLSVEKHCPKRMPVHRRPVLVGRDGRQSLGQSLSLGRHDFQISLTKAGKIRPKNCKRAGAHNTLRLVRKLIARVRVRSDSLSTLPHKGKGKEKEKKTSKKNRTFRKGV